MVTSNVSVPEYATDRLVAILVLAAVIDIGSTIVSLGDPAAMHITIAESIPIGEKAIVMNGEVILGHAEGNPAAAWILDRGGVLAMTAFKFAAVVAIVYLPTLGRDKRQTFAYGVAITTALWLTASAINVVPVIFG